MGLDSALSRRSLLGASAAACSACVVTACSSGNGGSQAGGTPAPVASGGTPVQVMQLADLPVGTSANGEANGHQLLLHRPDEQTVLAYTAICTHQGCTVGPADAEFHCPCHGSVYSAADGTVLGGPAPEPLQRYAAGFDGDWITVTI